MDRKAAVEISRNLENIGNIGNLNAFLEIYWKLLEILEISRVSNISNIFLFWRSFDHSLRAIRFFAKTFFAYKFDGCQMVEAMQSNLKEEHEPFAL